MTARRVAVLIAACAAVSLTGCATGSLAASDASAPVSSAASVSSVAITGATVVVTVPDLVVAVPDLLSASSIPQQAAPISTASSPLAPPSAAIPPAAAPLSAEAESVAPETAAAATALSGAATPKGIATPTRTAVARPTATVSPSGDGLNVSLANCDGCSVLATHRGVTGDLSAALVGTASGRAVLLAVAGDGQVRGVINILYGSAFAAPDNGVLACEQSRCIVEGRQSDGRAILSAFELTDSGAWRDVSGDDAFPSATEQAAAVDIDGQLAIAVQDQADSAVVWMLYIWDGERFAVAGCAADGPVPSSLDDVSESTCLS